MLFELQIPYPLKETDGSSFDGAFTIERWISRKLKENRGHLLEYSGTGGDSSLTIEFDELDDAKAFNRELHEFFSPRMYLDTETDSSDRFQIMDPRA